MRALCTLQGIPGDGKALRADMRGPGNHSSMAGLLLPARLSIPSSGPHRAVLMLGPTEQFELGKRVNGRFTLTPN